MESPTRSAPVNAADPVATPSTTARCGRQWNSKPRPQSVRSRTRCSLPFGCSFTSNQTTISQVEHARETIRQALAMSDHDQNCLFVLMKFA